MDPCSPTGPGPAHGFAATRFRPHGWQTSGAFFFFFNSQNENSLIFPSIVEVLYTHGKKKKKCKQYRNVSKRK